MTKKTTTGYGYFRMSDAAIPKFVIHEDVRHRVRLVIVKDGNYSIRCSRRGCHFRIGDIATLEQANELASKHMESAAVQRKNQE